MSDRVEKDAEISGDPMPPSDALARVARTGQEVILRRLDVLRLEIEQSMVHARSEITAGLVATLLFATAWFLLCGAAVVSLRALIGLPAALAAGAALNGCFGLIVLRAPGKRHGG